MAIFYYKAKTFSGQTITGSREAESKKELAKSLLKENYILISAESTHKEKSQPIKISIGKKKISLTEKMIFTQHLAIMVDVGFPFEKSLSILAHQIQNKNFKEIILKIMDDVIKGESFSDALQKHPRVFDELYVNMVKVGEEAGNLTEVLNLLANQMEKDHKLLGKAKGAMIYPAVILTVMILVGIVTMIMIVPKFSEMFEEMNMELPLATKFIIGIGNFLNQYWYFIPIIIFILIFGITQFKKTKSGKKMLDEISLKIPIIGSLNIKINTARTCRIISSLLSSGVSLVRTLEILSNTLSNICYKEAIISVLKEFQKGKPLYKCLTPYEKIYSFLLIQMTAIGEETGRLDKVLVKLARFYEEEVDDATKNISSIIEPILIVVIGLAVGFFAIAIIQPMYGMMGGV
jgi:type IV pilus assembly protein PilC